MTEPVFAAFLVIGLAFCYAGQVFTNIGIRMYMKGKTNDG